MISSTTRIAGPYSGTGIQTVFTFAFKVFQTSDVLVVLTDPYGNNTTQTLPNVAGQSIFLLPPILSGQPSNTIVKLLCTAATMPSVLLEW